MSDPWVAFISARLAEDEAAANAVLFACRDSRLPWPPEQAPGAGGPALTAFLARFSERRRIAEVAALRAVLAEHATVDGCCGRCSPDEEQPQPVGWWIPAPCPTVRALGGIWDSHPDYAALAA